MEDLKKQFLSMHNIVKDGNDYKLQNNYYLNGDKLIPVVKFEDRDDHNCDICSHYCYMGGLDGHCEIYNRLLNLKEHQFAWASSVINCAAYDKIEKLNIIKSFDDMITFIEKTQNFFGSPEDYENYYGFCRNWDENTGEILETVREYYNRGGSFANVPDKYPAVIRFDWNLKDELEWIYIGKD